MAGTPVGDSAVNPEGEENRAEGVALLNSFPGEEGRGVEDKEFGGGAVSGKEPWCKKRRKWLMLAWMDSREMELKAFWRSTMRRCL